MKTIKEKTFFKKRILVQNASMKNIVFFIGNQSYTLYPSGSITFETRKQIQTADDTPYSAFQAVEL